MPGVLSAAPSVVAEGIRVLSQLRVHYRHSPLSVRLADGSVAVGGRRCRVHELTAVPRVHVLLEAAAGHFDESALGPLVHVHRVLGRPGAGVRVVGPDGYVGFRAAAVDTRQVKAWLGLVAATSRAATPSPV